MTLRADHSAARYADDFASLQVEYNEATNTFQAEFDPATRLASEAVVNTVARANGADSLDLPPLYSAIDSDALNAIFTRTLDRSTPAGGTVTFTYADCTVTVRSHGTIEAEPVD
jgi:hypothetical protein